MRLLLVLALLQGCLCFPYFQLKVPNGDRIPHPCKPNYIWHGLGHKNSKGGGERNPFGEDFERNGFVWDKCLCERDSDGDGKTNGEELGDPNCKWKPGEVPEAVAISKITHPGVCDPHDSEKCKSKNDWEFCNVEDFHCPALEAEGVKNFTIRFPKTKVPSDATTYMCMLFEIDLESDDGQEIMHIIGSKGQIDNANVMHHIVVSACNSDLDKAIVEKYKTPQPCNMAPGACSGSFGGWTVGMEGTCLPAEYGISVGKKSSRTYAMMEFHWNNPEKRSDYVDGSGMTYFYEKKKREHNAGGAAVGPIYMEIPPAQSEWVESLICEPRCTENLQETKYISNILPHMHYLGRRFKMEHFRGGKKLRDLVVQNEYRYDTPETENFDPPIEVLPGDHFAVHCTFNSKGTDTWTYYGEGTYDEMCFALMTYYPERPGDFSAISCFGIEDYYTVCPSDFAASQAKENSTPLPMNTGTTPRSGSTTVSPSMIPSTTVKPTQTNTMAGCDVEMYFNKTFALHYAALSVVCDEKGVKCHEPCQDEINRIKNHPCYKYQELSIMSSLGQDEVYAKPYRRMYHSCKPVPKDKNPDKEEKKTKSVLCDPKDTSGAEQIIRPFTLLVASFFMAVYNAI